MLRALRADLAIIKERDPAARGTLEILLCYPGLHALALHRLSHGLWRLGLPLLPRHILVDRPDKKGREEILKVHLKNVTAVKNLD
ncbi:MAG: hypothetical protein R6W06_01030, partial [Prochlorococcaceae cyanobacterium]